MLKRIAKRFTFWLIVGTPMVAAAIIPGCPLLPS